jgi:peptide/nickel transport system permease protein
MNEEKPEKFLRSFWKQYKKSKMALVGLVLVIGLITMALIPSVLSPYDPLEHSLQEIYQPPSAEHPLGTDNLGRDMLSRIISAAQFSLTIGLSASGISVALGIFFGALAGYFRGYVDNLLMRVSDILLVLPAIYLYIMILSLYRTQNIFFIAVLIGVITWPRLARIVRSIFLSLRETDYVKAAKMLGASNSRIMFKHMLPATIGPIIVTACFNIAAAILTEAALSFLGLTDPTALSWGIYLNKARIVIYYAWWLIVFPGFMIFLSVASFMMVGDGIRDALDPRQRGAQGISGS